MKLYISNGKCYTYTTPTRYLKLSSDNKYIIEDDL